MTIPYVFIWTPKYKPFADILKKGLSMYPELEDKSMESTMNAIFHAEFFIGLSSGLSWLAWALYKKVVMISNFSAPDHEFNCIRVTNPSVCNSCWNDPMYKFDKSDWGWCPKHKGSFRQFECQKSITAMDVFNELNKNNLLCY